MPPQVPYSVVLNMLNRLAQQNDVEKITRPEMRSRYWRAWPQELASAWLPGLEAGQ